MAGVMPSVVRLLFMMNVDFTLFLCMSTCIASLEIHVVSGQGRV